MFSFKGTDKAKLVSLTLHEDKNCYPRYYLRAVYKVEDERGVHMVTFPRIILPVVSSFPAIVIEHGHFDDEVATVDIGFGEMPMHKEDGVYVVAELLKEKVHDMTIADIEKQLGYKIRVVSDNKKE